MSERRRLFLTALTVNRVDVFDVENWILYGQKQRSVLYFRMTVVGLIETTTVVVMVAVWKLVAVEIDDVLLQVVVIVPIRRNSETQ